jgi:hypothetical protein
MMKMKSYFCKHIVQHVTINRCYTLVVLHFNIRTGESIDYCRFPLDVLTEREYVARKMLEEKYGGWLIFLTKTEKFQFYNKIIDLSYVLGKGNAW